jgi:hypothetical protein
MKFSVASRITLLNLLALFVATFGGVTPMVDNLRDVRPPRRGGARRLLERPSENFSFFPRTTVNEALLVCLLIIRSCVGPSHKRA